MSSSESLAREVISALVEVGVREVVLAPGSRNGPLGFAAYDAEQAGLIRLHTRIDERSAGFLALGLTIGGSRAAVMCTSGTAVANLHPAALEAAHAGVPAVFVTADRPARLRGTGANQTTDQVDIFGRLLGTEDLVAIDDLTPDCRNDVWSARGPVHWNVQFDEPLTPSSRWTPGPIEVRPQAPVIKPMIYEQIDAGPGSPHTVVVAGDDAGPPARDLAEKAGWPLFAEPSSGSRTGENAIRTYRLLLGDPAWADRIERVVVYGHPTLSRPVMRLLARDDVTVVSEHPSGVWADRPFAVDSWFMTQLHPDGTPDPGWFDDWRAADASVGRQLDELLAALPLTGQAVAGAVSSALPALGLLTIGASNPIRDLDLMVPRYRVGDRRKVIANRGLAGIDGVMSTAIGAALGRPHTTRGYALLGDVSFLHDTNALVIGPDEPRPDLTIVVVNDDGGSIFATLEQGADDYADRYERLFGTPHGMSLESLCAASHTPHLKVTSLPELEQALATPNGGIEVIEAVVPRHDRRALDERIRALRA